MNEEVAYTVEAVCKKLLAAGYIFHDTETDAWPACASLLCKNDVSLIVTPLPDVIGEVHMNVLSHFTSKHSGVIMVGTLPAGSPAIRNLFSRLGGRYVYINPQEKSYLRHVSWGLFTPAPRTLGESWCKSYASGEPTPAEAAVDVRTELHKHMASHAETSAFIDKVNQATGFRRPQVTWAMIIIFAAVYVIMALLYHTTQFTTAQLLKWGADQGQKIVDGEYWRLLTAGFVHANFMHIFFNCLGCYYFGSAVEQYQGRARLVGIFLFAVVTGNIAGLWMHPESVAIGASGGLFGLIGMMAAMTIRYYRQMPHMLRNALKKWIASILVYNLFFMIIPQVDISAHAGGFAGGFIMGLIAARPLGSKDRPSIATLAMAAILLILTANLGMKVIAGLPAKLKKAEPQLIINLTPEQIDYLRQNNSNGMIAPMPGKPGHFYVIKLHPEYAPSVKPKK
ncbi:MAG TPA: rhomboid family intramembrane serine protease [Phycisphaerae bacterium]|mgnify:CR=1 FL=1|nr:rhomboid family intramembrane serine protease [Phycisphaerae bacterium]HPS53845.1 rhomboid family intramembrane serine protease [Phycisphaerae bacterium]